MPSRDADYGLVIVGPGSVVQRIDKSARRLLREFFAARGTSRLPELLRQWTTIDQRSRVAQRPGRPRSRSFAVDRNGRRLVVRVIPYGVRRFLILEEKPVPRTTDLAALRLSRRETEVLSWVASGKTNDEIAAILGISPSTIKKHLEHIYGKLGVETRTAAAAIALAVSPQPTRGRPVLPPQHPSIFAKRRIDSQGSADYTGHADARKPRGPR